MVKTLIHSVQQKETWNYVQMFKNDNKHVPSGLYTAEKCELNQSVEYKAMFLCFVFQSV